MSQCTVVSGCWKQLFHAAHFSLHIFILLLRQLCMTHTADAYSLILNHQFEFVNVVNVAGGHVYKWYCEIKASDRFSFFSSPVSVLIPKQYGGEWPAPGEAPGHHCNAPVYSEQSQTLVLHLLKISAYLFDNYSHFHLEVLEHDADVTETCTVCTFFLFYCTLK